MKNMRKVMTLLLSAAAIFAAPVFNSTADATDAQVRSTTTTTQGQACTTMLALAEHGRAYLQRPLYLTTTGYMMRVGIDWELGNINPTEQVSLLMTLACSQTGSLDGRLDMQLQYPWGYPLGAFQNGQLIIAPKDGFSGVNTIVSATRGQACFAMLGLANRNNAGGLIQRSYNSQIGYVAVVTDNWINNLTNEQKIATLLTLMCGATGGTNGRLDMQVQDQLGNAIGQLVSGRMELY